jgi:hypothetical protein
LGAVGVSPTIEDSKKLRSYVWLDEEGTYSARKAQFHMIGQANIGTTPSRTLMKQYDICTLYMRTG